MSDIETIANDAALASVEADVEAKWPPLQICRKMGRRIGRLLGAARGKRPGRDIT
ncbi:hypothetical protein [Hoeflea sp.]|uniref:hypothetical protein n=1 Tax=Hoeflea sp. TaxID=1940281 RepID=UPI003B0229B0